MGNLSDEIADNESLAFRVVSDLSKEALKSEVDNTMIHLADVVDAVNSVNDCVWKYEAQADVAETTLEKFVDALVLNLSPLEKAVVLASTGYKIKCP